jgi:hypothetical protein
MRDWSKLRDGDRIILHPNLENPLHSEPIKATFSDGYFYCEGSRPSEGPDFYWNDVHLYNTHFEYIGDEG